MTVLPTIRRQLLQAAERNAAAGAPTFSWPRSKWGVPRRLALATSHVLTVALIALTIAVAAGAILLLGHGRHSQVAASSAPSTRQELLQTLGVLQTSQTATDRSVAACIERTAHKFVTNKCLHYVPEIIGITESPAPVANGFIASVGNPKWDLALIRTVPLGLPGAAVTFYPGTWRGVIEGPTKGMVSSPPPSAPRGWGFVATFVDHGYAESSQTTVGTLRAHGLVLLPYTRPSTLLAVAIIVPDGVSKVTVGMVTLGGQHWSENVTEDVHDNVAAVQLRVPGSRFTGVQSASLRMTWLGARGAVIRRTTTATSS